MAERSRTLFWAIYGLWRSLKARHSDLSVSKVPKALQEARTPRQDYPGASGSGLGSPLGSVMNRDVMLT